MRWQPLQWQAAVMIGGATISMLTCPQRQCPDRGNLIGLINAASHVKV
jgi:hypothetical protein